MGETLPTLGFIFGSVTLGVRGGSEKDREQQDAGGQGPPPDSRGVCSLTLSKKTHHTTLSTKEKRQPDAVESSQSEITRSQLVLTRSS